MKKHLQPLWMQILALIVAMVLFTLGSAAVKGFAVTLTIGILASMLTSIVFTRAIVNVGMWTSSCDSIDWQGGGEAIIRTN